MEKYPFRVKLFLFLITPSELWIHVMAFLCGITYENNSKFENRE